ILTNMALEGEDAANYLINTPTLSATIQPLEVKVMGALALNKTYDGGTSARITGAELSGLIDGDEIWLQDFAEGIFAQSTVGSSIPVRAAMKLGGGHSNNYVLIQPELYADILPLELSVIGAIAHPKI